MSQIRQIIFSHITYFPRGLSDDLILSILITYCTIFLRMRSFVHCIFYRFGMVYLEASLKHCGNASRPAAVFANRGSSLAQSFPCVPSLLCPTVFPPTWKSPQAAAAINHIRRRGFCERRMKNAPKMGATGEIREQRDDGGWGTF